MGSKSPSTVTNVTKSELPAWATPYSQQLMEMGAAQAARPYEAYQGQTISPLSQEQQMGLAQTVQRATQGNQAMNAGQNMLTNTLSGGYLSPNTNPYIANMVDTALGQAKGQLNSQFNKPGAWGSTAQQEVMARGLGDIAANMYGQNYTNERGNQMNAANQALGYGAADYQDANALLSAGDTTRQYSQDLLNKQFADWQAQQQYPLTQIDILGKSLGLATSGQGSVTGIGPNPYQPNTTANLLGGGLSLAGLAGMLNNGG